MTPSEYSQEKQEQLRALAESIGQRHQVKSVVTKQREQSARQLEDELKAHLNDIVQRILDEKSSDISLIQHNYSMEVEHVIRASTTSAYIVGLNYVGARKQRLHHMFLTVLDIEKIKNLTAEFTQIFWRRVFAILHQKDTVQNILKNARFSHRSTLTLNSLVTNLAAKIITKAIALATVAKVNALRSLPPTNQLKSAQVVEVLIWTTQHDERVCPICQGLDGMKWNSDDINLLIPPDDTHPNCRCRLDIAGPEGEDTGVEALPGLEPGLY